ncbi:MAG: ATP-binding cassette domain-containing protein [Proteobacteria bacterium]|nr:ATP-binding cassette domain-containing protein [Pseudomonadota bacterium]
MKNANECLIEVSKLQYQYPDGTHALRDINLKIFENQFIALIGQNGSGKTTLAKSLNGLLKPSSGYVKIDGLDTRVKGTTKKIVTKVGYVFQNPDHQLFSNTIEKEIAYGPKNIGLGHDEVNQRVQDAAQVCGVERGLFQDHPFFLTKGLRQRVAIASILAMRPKTIIVDEPTTGQDLRQSLEVMNFLRDLWLHKGHTIIIITHDMNIVADYAQRCVVLTKGELVMDGATREIFSQPDILAKAYVKPPQITRLAQDVLEYNFPKDVLSVEEMIQAFKKIARKEH